MQLEFFGHTSYFYIGRKPVPDPLSKQEFESALNRAAALSARQPQDPNSIFATVLCHGLRATYLALIEKHYAASFREIKVARTVAEQLLAQHPEYYDAWIIIGLENYILSLDSTSVGWLLRLSGGQTKQALGIEKLRLTAEKGHYLAPLARLVLAVVALRGHNTDGARKLLAGLAHDFPNNPLYSQELAVLSR